MVAFSNHHSGPLTYDVLGDEDDIPFLRAMFGDQAVDFQIWKHGSPMISTCLSGARVLRPSCRTPQAGSRPSRASLGRTPPIF